MSFWNFNLPAFFHKLGPQPMQNLVPAQVGPPSLETIEGTIAAQQRLINVGYLDPPADGQWGGASRLALQQFCTRMGLSSGTGNTLPSDVVRGLMYPNISVLCSPIVFDTGLASKIVKTMIGLKMYVPRMPGCYIIAYVEGMNPDGTLNDNGMNKFADIRTVIEISSGRPRLLLTPWYATTEPGKYWGVDNPMNADGAFHVALNTQQKCHVMGNYHTMSALVQASPIKGTRDPHRTGVRDLRYPVEGMFGVHHHGGYDLPHDNLGRSSAGCLVGESMEGHELFCSINRQDARFKANPAYKFMFCVLDGRLVVNKV
jgi:hypothetical protein